MKTKPAAYTLPPGDDGPTIEGVETPDDLELLLAETLDLDETCPRCGYPGLVLDEEFGAYVHDHCGYWQDQ